MASEMAVVVGDLFGTTPLTLMVVSEIYTPVYNRRQQVSKNTQ